MNNYELKTIILVMLFIVLILFSLALLIHTYYLASKDLKRSFLSSLINIVTFILTVLIINTDYINLAITVILEQGIITIIAMSAIYHKERRAVTIVLLMIISLTLGWTVKTLYNAKISTKHAQSIQKR